MFAFPEQAKVGRVVPKSKIYQHAKVGSKLERHFIDQLERIVWQYKLAPETINLPAHAGIAEIQVFDLKLKTPKLDEGVLRAIDQAVPHPIIFHLHASEQTRMVAAHKRPSDADGGKWVIGDYLTGPWLAQDHHRHPLPVALDLHGLYEQLLRSLLSHPARPGESLPSQLERMERLRVLERERDKLEACMKREKQFNRKVSLNSQLREISNKIKRYT